MKIITIYVETSLDLASRERTKVAICDAIKAKAALLSGISLLELGYYVLSPALERPLPQCSAKGSCRAN